MPNFVLSAIDELGHILGDTNRTYIDDTKKRWETFCANVQFYGLWKKVLKHLIPVDMRGGMYYNLHLSDPNPTHVCICMMHLTSIDWKPCCFFHAALFMW